MILVFDVVQFAVQMDLVATMAVNVDPTVYMNNCVRNLLTINGNSFLLNDAV